jgi:hypothetical protein
MTPRRSQVQNGIDATRVGDKLEEKLGELKKQERNLIEKAKQKWKQVFAEKEESPKIQMIRTHEVGSSGAKN